MDRGHRSGASFQTAPDFSAGIDFEPSGYFCRRGWLKDTWGIIIIGEKKQNPPRNEICRKALRQAVELTRKPRINMVGERHNGLAAYTAWAEAISKDEDFPAKDLIAAINCYEAEHSLMWKVWGLVGGIGWQMIRPRSLPTQTFEARLPR